MPIFFRLPFALLLFAGMLSPARADSYFNFVHINCVPASGYLFFEGRDVEGADVLGDTQFDDAKRAQRMKIWEKNGYFDPKHLRQVCVMGAVRYTIVASQPEPMDHGTCGGAPMVTLSLYRNDTPWIDHVTFGSTCSGDPSLRSVELSEPKEGWGTSHMTLCTGETSESCKFFSEDIDQSIANAIPIGQAKIEEYAAKK